MNVKKLIEKVNGEEKGIRFESGTTAITVFDSRSIDAIGKSSEKACFVW